MTSHPIVIKKEIDNRMALPSGCHFFSNDNRMACSSGCWWMCHPVLISKSKW